MQNLKMLVLTAPGERIMLPDFGVGLRNYLFEQNTSSTYSVIDAKIREQVKFYMPFVEVVDVKFNPVYDTDSSGSGLNVNIDFRIIPFDLFSSLEIEVGN